VLFARKMLKIFKKKKKRKKKIIKRKGKTDEDQEAIKNIRTMG